jgi:hypothetical protein
MQYLLFLKKLQIKYSNKSNLVSYIKSEKILRNLGVHVKVFHKIQNSKFTFF